MAFEYINLETGDILDILDRRTSREIKDHFIANYSLKDRKKVETVTIDKPSLTGILSIVGVKAKNGPNAI